LLCLRERQPVVLLVASIFGFIPFEIHAYKVYANDLVSQ
jgi:hypothetical protein